MAACTCSDQHREEFCRNEGARNYGRNRLTGKVTCEMGTNTGTSVSLFVSFSAVLVAGVNAPLMHAQSELVHSPEFDVTSVKPYNPALMLPGMTVNRDCIVYHRVTLRDCIKSAYDVFDFQISGAERFRVPFSDRYDIVAKTAACWVRLRTVQPGYMKDRIRATTSSAHWHNPVSGPAFPLILHFLSTTNPHSSVRQQ
jgi:hypothetical protein